MWPADAESLIALQRELATLTPEPWPLPAGDDPLVVGAVWVCFPRGLSGPGAPGDPAWCAAVALRGGRLVERQVTTGAAAAAYRPGLMALRVGALLEQAVGRLSLSPDVLLLDATGRDHPRRAGLALHLGQVLDVPTMGVTHRPLSAGGEWPDDRAGASSPLLLDGAEVARWLRTRAGTRPLVVHPGWRVDVDTAVDAVRRVVGRRRTPEPLRQARRVARRARSRRPAAGSAPAAGAQ